MPVECGPVTKGCSCASAEVEPKTIPPGGEAILTVVWKLAGKRGPSLEAVSVPYTGAGDVRGAVYARVTANVRTAVEPSVEVLELSKDRPAGEVSFASPTGKPFRVTGARANHPCLTAEVDAAENRVRVRFNPAVSGWESGRLAVTVLTDEPEDRGVMVWVRVG